MEPADVELTLFANLDIITTPFDIVMLVELKCVGTHGVHLPSIQRDTDF